MIKSEASLDHNNSLGRAFPVTASLPFLKWAGGKRALVPDILSVFPLVTGKYFEPFVGGAAIFFALAPNAAVLSDVNAELIDCYQAIKDDPEGVASRLYRLKNDETSYYAVRLSRPTSRLSRAARLIYLTTLSFNGIYRQNLKGEFNVPYGYKTHKRLPGVEDLRTVSQRLSSATLVAGDFEAVTASAVSGDCVYFDPPYTVAHNNNGFVKYNASIFSWEDQKRLALHAARLADRGCHVFVSNADHDAVRELYSEFDLKVITRHSVIAANSENRKIITECLFHSTTDC